MNQLDYGCINCTLKSNAVSILDRNELGLLEEGCSKLLFKNGELIFKEGAPASHITYVRSGFIKMIKRGIGGKDFILGVSKKGTYIGIQNLNRKSGKNYFSAIAVTDSELCFIEIDVFERLLKKNGNFAAEVIATICNDEMNYFERLVNNVQQQLPGRLANTLSYFRNQVYNTNPFHLNLSRIELASLIGTSRESVSRILKEFHDEKIIRMSGREIMILNESKLEEIKQKG